MKIAGFQKLTLLDYPEKIAALIFTQSCNLTCGYCHNPEMISKCSPENDRPELQQGYILDFLAKRRGILDGVVISGGEPTLQPDLADFISQIKAMGFLVKLDTNGSHSDVLSDLLDKELLDYIAMDVKFSPKDYEKYFPSLKSTSLMRSIQLIMRSGLDYEFRSTVLPFYHAEKDIEEIGAMIKGANKWYLQSFRPLKTLDRRLSKERAFSGAELAKLKLIAENYAESVELRT